MKCKEHIHQDATYQDHSRIPSQPQPSPLIGLGHKTLHEDVFGPNYPSLDVHHREQPRVVSISIETSNNLFTSLNNSLSNQCCLPRAAQQCNLRRPETHALARCREIYIIHGIHASTTDTDSWHTFVPAQTCLKLQ